jgi:hypothetical protein
LDIVQDAMFKLVDRYRDRPAAELAPFDREWDRLEPRRRQRWLNVAERYPDMPAERQQRLQARMREWTQLTPEQREQAGERYRHLRNMPPEERAKLHERWREYRNLTEDQRQELREHHHHKDRQD